MTHIGTHVAIFLQEFLSLFIHLSFLSSALNRFLENSRMLRSEFSDLSHDGFTAFDSTAFAPHICVTVEARLHLPASAFPYRCWSGGSWVQHDKSKQNHRRVFLCMCMFLLTWSRPAHADKSGLSSARHTALHAPPLLLNPFRERTRRHPW